jgi:hypothetical protein
VDPRTAVEKGGAAKKNKINYNNNKNNKLYK